MMVTTTTAIDGRPVTEYVGVVTGEVGGAILEMICALAGIGTTVALFPIVKRQNEAVALGYVADGSNPKRISPCNPPCADHWEPAWSPDGRGRR